MKSLVALIFRILFRIKSFQKHFYGIHKKILIPFNILNSQTKTVQIENGIQLELQIDDWIQENIYFLNSYEPIETTYIRSILKQGHTFIDIGANIGFHSLVAAKKVSSIGKVISFEPFESNFLSLQKNVDINNFSCITIHQLAISNTKDDISLFYNEREKNKGMVSSVSTIEGSSQYTVASIRLDDYISQSNIQEVHFIKLDIEGGEFPALQGMQETLKSHHPILMIEMDEMILSKTNYSEKQFEHFLNDLGYRPFYFTDQGELTHSKIDSVSKNVIFKHH